MFPSRGIWKLPAKEAIFSTQIHLLVAIMDGRSLRRSWIRSASLSWLWISTYVW